MGKEEATLVILGLNTNSGQQRVRFKSTRLTLFDKGQTREMIPD